MDKAKKTEIFVGVVGAVVGVVGLFLSIYNFIDAKKEKEDQDFQQQEIIIINKSLLDAQRKISELEAQKLKLQESFLNSDVEVISRFDENENYFYVDVIGGSNLDVSISVISGLIGINRQGDFNVQFKDVCVREKVVDLEIKSYKCVDLERKSDFENLGVQMLERESINMSADINNYAQAKFYSLFNIRVENSYFEEKSFSKFYYVDMHEKNHMFVDWFFYNRYKQEISDNYQVLSLPKNQRSWKFFYEERIPLIR